MLVISNFSKSYGDALILSVKSLALPPGVHLIKGDNGSGKTTFFKCLAGIIPCSGEINIDRLSLKTHSIAYRYHVNFAEAEPLYPGFLTAKDLIRFIGKTKNATPQQENYYTQKLGIDRFFEKSCDTYSSGMLKKLSLALAFLGDPKMIILDEPLITLDEQTRAELFKLIQEKKETTFLLSSHQSIESRSLEFNTTYAVAEKSLILE